MQMKSMLKVEVHQSREILEILGSQFVTVKTVKVRAIALYIYITYKPQPCINGSLIIHRHQRIFKENQMMLQYFNQVLKNHCSSVINSIVPLRMIPTVSMQKEQTNSAASVRI